MAKSGPAPGARATRARGGATKVALVTAAHQALRERGYAGASAREIARRAGCEQGLVFYHFGSVTGLFAATLQDVSDRRLAAIGPRLASAGTLPELVDLLRSIVREDIDSGDLTVLAELMVAARAAPDLAPAVAAVLAPWEEVAATGVRAALSGLPLGALVPVEDVAHTLVALTLGLELLADSTGGRERVDALLARAGAAAGLLGLLMTPTATDVPAPSQNPTSERGIHE